MKVYIDQAEYSWDSISLMEFNDFWKQETKRLYDANKYFHTVEINGLSYLTGYEEAIVNNFSDIKEIKIATISEKELIEDSLKELYAYNKKLISACESIGALFYGDMNEEDWKSFSMLTEGIQWFYTNLNGIQAVLNKNNQHEELEYLLKETEHSLAGTIKDIEQALEEKEHTQLADIISYELSEIFVRLDANLSAYKQVIE